MWEWTRLCQHLPCNVMVVRTSISSVARRIGHYFQVEYRMIKNSGFATGASPPTKKSHAKEKWPYVWDHRALLFFARRQTGIAPAAHTVLELIATWYHWPTCTLPFWHVLACLSLFGISQHWNNTIFGWLIHLRSLIAWFNRLMAISWPIDGHWIVPSGSCLLDLGRAYWIVPIASRSQPAEQDSHQTPTHY